MKYITLILLFGLLIAVIAPCKADDAGNTLTIGYMASASTPLYDIAQAEHYFADEGVTVELRAYPSSAAIVQAVTNHDVFAGILPTITWLGAVTAGTPLTVIAGQGQATYRLVAAKSVYQSIKGLNAVADKRVGIIIGETSATVYRASLIYAGFPATINDHLQVFASLDALLHALQNGTIGVGVVDNAATAVPKDLTVFTLPIDAVASRTVNHLVVSPTTWAQHEAVGQKLLSALLRSQVYLQSHGAEAFSLVKQHHPDLSDDLITDAIKNSTLQGDRDGILALYTLLQQDGSLSADGKPLTHVDLEPYHQALLSLNTRFPNEGYYQDQLLALGDYGVLPDCCQ
jgi:ABC-type nitrate/sulfonate/bicarbonate transport system substrate-binding protein